MFIFDYWLGSTRFTDMVRQGMRINRLRAGGIVYLSWWGLVPSTKSMGDVLLAKLAALAEPKVKSVLVSLDRHPRISGVSRV